MATHSAADRIFSEVMFGAIGLAVILASLMTLADFPEAAPMDSVSERAEASLWVGDASMHLVDVSALVAPAPDKTIPEEEDTIAEAEAEAEEVEEDVISAPSGANAEAAAPEIAEDPAEVDEQVAQGKPKGKKVKGKRCSETPDPLIRSVSPGIWSVDQRVVQRYTRDWSRLADLGWSQAHKDASGRTDGMQIGGVRCGSDLHDAGFRSGDVIHTVNGKKIQGIPSAILAYTALHNDHVFAVEITRRGERKTLTYRLKG